MFVLYYSYMVQARRCSVHERASFSLLCYAYRRTYRATTVIWQSHLTNDQKSNHENPIRWRKNAPAFHNRQAKAILHQKQTLCLECVDLCATTVLSKSICLSLYPHTPSARKRSQTALHTHSR